MITTVWQLWSLTNCDVIGKFTWNGTTGLEIRKLEVSSAPRHQWTRGNLLFFLLHMLYVCSAQCRRKLCNTDIKYKIRTGCRYIVHTRGVHGLDFGFFGSLLLLPPTGSGVRLFAVDGAGMYLDFVITEKTLLFVCLIIFMRSQTGFGLLVSCWYRIRGFRLKIWKTGWDPDSKKQSPHTSGTHTTTKTLN